MEVKKLVEGKSMLTEAKGGRTGMVRSQLSEGRESWS